ncbi:hypothetical protein VHEMI08575 [[Torrubiella] hemipterigena]|uniref:Uncharacterized protein n=1 Tax=[Torrubiella] hemipterigena TaxID=1531966 RepID=A0A0A1TNP4_9HYPO|nr:hypothetical protein VHEMI08575 [[Torrubiella] hemipterigena]
MSAPSDVAFTTTIHHDTYPAIAKASHAGHTVFISGASKGIGRATALSFAKAGVKNLVIAARSNLDEVERDILAVSNTNVLKIQLDVTSKESIQAAADRVAAEFGTLDVLVNNAGILNPFQPVAESDPTKWWDTYNVNLHGLYLVTRAFVPLLLRGSAKAIVNVASIGGIRTAPGGSAYQLSKTTVIRFTEYLNVEYKDHGLCSYAIHPGAVKSDLASNLPSFIPQSSLIDTPELPADTISWLTQEPHSWLSGRYFSVNWDMEELFSKKDEIVSQDKLRLKLVV